MLDALNDTLNIIIDYITYKDLTNLNNISKKKELFSNKRTRKRKQT